MRALMLAEAARILWRVATLTRCVGESMRCVR